MKQNFIQPKKPNYKKHTLTVGQILLIPIRLIPYAILLCLIMVVLIAVFAGISIAPYYASLKTVYAEGVEGQNHLVSAESLIKEQNFKLAIKELGSAEDNFKNAGQALSMAGQAAIFRNDLVKEQLLVAQDIVEIGQIMSGALKNITQKGLEIQTILNTDKIVWQDISAEQKGAVLQVLSNSTEELIATQKDLNDISQKLVDINSHNPLFIFNKVVNPLQSKLPKTQKAFESLITVAKLLPAFSGYPEEKTYLFILQNNREMRPSGGFIGTYGILKIKNAEIVEFFTDNSYNLDRLVEGKLDIEPPEPIEKYMNQDHWYFRDSNWWPDFATSAEKASWFYHQEGGEEKLDGVIAITPTVIEKLLGVLGNFTIQDLLFNQGNFWEQLQYQVEFGYYEQGISESDRKDIIGDLGEQIIQRLYTAPMSQFSDILAMVSSQVKEKQIQLYFVDDEMQNLAMQNGWAGEVKGYAGDYLMLVDANLAALKTDSVMDRTVQYDLDVDDNHDLIATARVNYQNMGTFSWKTTRYRTYTRLYVPEGSELISVKVGNTTVNLEEDVDTYQEFGKTAFGLFFQVEPQTSRVVSWKYKLPARIKQYVDGGEYNLMVQKQAGIPKLNLQLDLTFDKKIRWLKDNLDNIGKNLKHVEVLTTDQIYTVWLE